MAAFKPTLLVTGSDRRPSKALPGTTTTTTTTTPTQSRVVRSSVSIYSRRSEEPPPPEALKLNGPEIINVIQSNEGVCMCVPGHQNESRSMHRKGSRGFYENLDNLPIMKNSASDTSKSWTLKMNQELEGYR